MHKNILNYLTQEQTDDLISKMFPDIVEVMKKVRKDWQIEKADREMIEQQLIILCGVLHDARKYDLELGVWRDGDVYSAKRAEAANGPTIRNETIFTIVPNGKKRKWLVYIDLPVAV